MQFETQADYQSHPILPLPCFPIDSHSPKTPRGRKQQRNAATLERDPCVYLTSQTVIGHSGNETLALRGPTSNAPCTPPWLRLMVPSEYQSRCNICAINGITAPRTALVPLSGSGLSDQSLHVLSSPEFTAIGPRVGVLHVDGVELSGTFPPFISGSWS